MQRPLRGAIRQVDQPAGIHTVALLNPEGMLDYLLGRLPHGTYGPTPGGDPFDPNTG